MVDHVSVVIHDPSPTSVTVRELDMFDVSTAMFNPTIVNKLTDIGDVDSTTLVNGSVLVYKTATNKWTTTTLLDLQTMEGGEY